MYDITPMWNVKKAELIETEKRMTVTRGWRVGGTGEILVKGYKLTTRR